MAGDRRCDPGTTVGCVQRGDILCRISGSTRVLRWETMADEFRILGTAWTPQERPHTKGEAADEGVSDMTTYVDIDMLCALLSPGLGLSLCHSVWGSKAGLRGMPSF